MFFSESFPSHSTSGESDALAAQTMGQPQFRSLLAALSFDHMHHDSSSNEVSHPSRATEERKVVKTKAPKLETVPESPPVAAFNSCDKQSKQPPSHRTKPYSLFKRIKRSFKHGAKFNQKQQYPPSDTASEEDTENYDIPVVRPVRHRRNLVGTMDQDGNVEVEFYDAQQYDDGIKPDENFQSSHESESSLMEHFLDPEAGSGDLTATTTIRGGGRGAPRPPPPPPAELPLRFLRAGKNDPVVGMQRYEASLAWRKEFAVDTALRRAYPYFKLTKQHYLHAIHFTGHKGEPVFYEKPAQTNLKALQASGMGVPQLLEHYVMVIEYLWQAVERDDLARSIYVLDLEGIKMSDFVGDVMEFVKQASSLCNHHYPERAGGVFVINVPRWFNMIWSVIKPLIDEATLEKIQIFRGTPKETAELLQSRIPIHHLPPEYGGTSVPLGQSPQEQRLTAWMEHLNENTRLYGHAHCNDQSCPYCSWEMARSY